MRTAVFSLGTALILYFAFYADFEAGAQLAKEAATDIQQKYAVAVTENDIRSYQIICESVDKKDYAAYSQVIREKIKERLRKSYFYHYREGDVNIFFVLNSDGSLIRLDIDKTGSTNDKELIEIAARSVKQASPFPRFPKNLSVLQMSFSVKISFKAA